MFWTNIIHAKPHRVLLTMKMAIDLKGCVLGPTNDWMGVVKKASSMVKEIRTLKMS